MSSFYDLLTNEFMGEIMSPTCAMFSKKESFQKYPDSLKFKSHSRFLEFNLNEKKLPYTEMNRICAKNKSCM